MPLDSWDQFPDAPQSRPAAPADPWAAFPDAHVPQAQQPVQRASDMTPEDVMMAMGEAPITTPGQSSGIVRGAWRGAIVDPVQGAGQLIAHGAAAAAPLFFKGPDITSLVTGKDESIPGKATRFAQSVDELVNKSEAGYQQAQRERGIPEGGDAGRMLGAVLSPVNLAAGEGTGLILGRAAEALPYAGNLAAPIARGIGIGGGMAATEPVRNAEDYWGAKGEQVKEGAVLGGASEAGTAVAGRIIGGITDPQKRLLYNEGVPLTWGQLLGTVRPGKPLGGPAKQFEDIAASVPVAGEFIKEAQAESQRALPRAGLNRALANIGEELPADMPMGREAIRHTYDTIGARYDALLGRATGHIDHDLLTDMFEINRGNNPITGTPHYLPQAQQDRLQEWTGNLYNLNNRYPNGIPGYEIQGFGSALRGEIRALGRSPDAYQRQLGQELGNFEGSFNRMVERVNPAIAPDLRNTNAAYANFVRVRDAAANANNGVPSPDQFARAVVRNARSKNQAAGGTALMQDLADAGKAVLPQSIPNSGTADRMEYLKLLGGVLAAGLGAHELGYNPLPIVAGGVGTAALYSRPGLALGRFLAAAGGDERRAIGEMFGRSGASAAARYQTIQNQGNDARAMGRMLGANP